ncbi:MFS transporter [Peribacillus tepidiphilus]|uniref:MFS transporter n=1 Tax=Peribacillus tepidiphilus TaxID=2652445 RepID=UPI001291705B|nr:MFS transporter [Peribacillus tepidiphilus]
MKSTALQLKNHSPQSVTAYRFLFIIGFCHLLNDSLQAVVPAMFPIIERSMALSYTQLGFIGFALSMISSVMQPAVGWYTDKKPMPYALPLGLTSTLIGIVLLALAPNYLTVIFSVILIGIGSAIFHPEGSRVAFMAAGTRRGLAQSIYQVGGNTGQALAPLITAIILVPLGQIGALWFAPVAFIAVLLLVYIARWYSHQVTMNHTKRKSNDQKPFKITPTIKKALAIILFLIFARSWYISCITNYFAFFLIESFSFSIEKAQIYLFAFLAAGALGTLLGGPLADRFGRKNIITISLLASAPLTILLPYVQEQLTLILLFFIGFILMSSFSVTVVYAQELIPGKVGTMSGLTVGLAFGMGAIGSVLLGALADTIGLVQTIQAVGYLPLLGLLSLMLPSDKVIRNWY